MKILLIFMIFSVKNRNFWFRASLILLIAGGLGNIFDRVFLGYVRDFVYFEIINFAVFNLADSELTIGCILLIVYVIFFYKPEDKKKEKTKQ